ncbi:molybdenum cofactor synthesis domain-containing protein [Rhizomicrobium palustre]|uniref:Molybdenum cofactor synthesis domain-containing protein n=1 Tax=Rhizomicrobium palustre TaxID=189966 RepID=A0A846MXW9_9PROT|nr:molybdopterin-binding protein [Rhizomicrobium palustre]NIK87981.1 molybdenum cofactor synthesis domain-containing protein [Rhizomicrobium palustre]
MTANPTAAILVIGNEILSGRTQDTNSNALARFLAPLGVALKEIRVVGDEEGEIIAAVNALRARYTYLFTTGGIGPTHDDITADAIAKAFGVGIDLHPEAFAALAARYAERGEAFNPMRQRMARIPLGASLIRNPVSIAPGFQLENVFVMAGVPSVMKAMLEDVAPRLRRGAVVGAVAVEAAVAEGDIAEGLALLQQEHPKVAIGSYPYYRPEGYGVQLVARGTDANELETVALGLNALLAKAGGTPKRL